MFKNFRLFLIVLFVFIVFVACNLEENTDNLSKNLPTDELTSVQANNSENKINEFLEKVKQNKKVFITVNSLIKAEHGGCHINVIPLDSKIMKNFHEEELSFGACGSLITDSDDEGHDKLFEELHKTQVTLMNLINNKLEDNIKLVGVCKYIDSEYENEEYIRYSQIYIEFIFEDGEIYIWDGGKIIS